MGVFFRKVEPTRDDASPREAFTATSLHGGVLFFVDRGVTLAHAHYTPVSIHTNITQIVTDLCRDFGKHQQLHIISR